MSYEEKNCVFVTNTSINVSNVKRSLKYKSSIHNINFSSEKVIVSESGEKYAQIKHHLQSKMVDNMGWTFSMEEALLWIMDSDFRKIKMMS